jgi:hypothetical protein
MYLILLIILTPWQKASTITHLSYVLTCLYFFIRLQIAFGQVFSKKFKNIILCAAGKRNMEIKSEHIQKFPDNRQNQWRIHTKYYTSTR